MEKEKEKQENNKTKNNVPKNAREVEKEIMDINEDGRIIFGS